MFIPRTQSLLVLGLILLSATQAFSAQQAQQIVATDANGNALSAEQLAALSQQAGNSGQQIVGVDQNGNEYAIPPEQLAAYLAQYQQGGQVPQAQPVAQPQVATGPVDQSQGMPFPTTVAQPQIIPNPVAVAAEPQIVAQPQYAAPEPVLAVDPVPTAQPQIIADPVAVPAQPQVVALPQVVAAEPVLAAQPQVVSIQPVEPVSATVAAPTVAQPQVTTIQPVPEPQVQYGYIQPVGVPAEPTVTTVEPPVVAQPQVATVEAVPQQTAYVQTGAPATVCGNNQVASGQCCVDECPALSYAVNGTCKHCDNEHCILGSTKLYQCSADNVFKGELTVQRHIAQFHQLVSLSLTPVALASASACSKVSVYADDKLVGEFSTAQSNYTLNFNHDNADLKLTFKCAASQTAKFSLCNLQIAVFECPNNYYKLNDISCTPACPAGTAADAVSRNCVPSEEQPVVQDPPSGGAVVTPVVVTPCNETTGSSIIITIPVVQESTVVVEPDCPAIVADPIVQHGGNVTVIPGFNFTGGINLTAVLAGAIGVSTGGHGGNLGLGGANGTVEVPCAGSNVKLNLVHNVTQIGGVAAVPQDPAEALSADLSHIFGVNVNVLEGVNNITTKRNIRRGQ